MALQDIINLMDGFEDVWPLTFSTWLWESNQCFELHDQADNLMEKVQVAFCLLNCYIYSSKLGGL